MTRTVSILIPAHNEAAYLPACARSVLASDPLPKGWHAEVLVIANGCSDRTAELAAGFSGEAEQKGFGWSVLELGQGGKLGALNAGDAAASGEIRVYLDADVIVSPPLLAQLIEVLDVVPPRYGSGQPGVAPARSAVTRAYGRFWQTLPFVTNGVPGFGLFAVNASGRDQWRDWPDIIADDLFARLNFAPADRIRVPARYSWPMVEGFGNLVRVRRRQNQGVVELARLYPHLLHNEDKPRPDPRSLLGRLLRDPIGFLIYAAVNLTTKSPLFRNRSRWARGR